MMKNDIKEWNRLQKGHPTLAKLVKLFNYCDWLGIHLDFSNGAPLITDYEMPDNHPIMWMQYVQTDEPVNEMPPSLDFKVIHKNPLFLAEQERIIAEYNKLQQDKKDKIKIDNEKTEVSFTLEGLALMELNRLKSEYEK